MPLLRQEISLQGHTVAFIGDTHFNSSTPKSRVDDFSKASLDKLQMLKLMMLERECKFLVIPGDVWHKRQQSLGYMADIVNVFREYREVGIRVFSLIGNHDLAYDRMDSEGASPLGLLFRTGLMTPLYRVHLEIPGGYSVLVAGFHYPETLENAEGLPGKLKICVAHRYFEYERDSYSLNRDDLTELGYHFYVLGHDHQTYPTQKVGNGKQYVIRTGSFMRGTSHKYNLEREVVVDFIHFNGSEEAPAISYKREPLPVRPASEVFSQAMFHKEESVAEIQRDLTQQIDELIDRMESSQVYQSIYDYLDALDEPEEGVKQRVVMALESHGIYRSLKENEA